jgi:hypothetical protein
MNIMSNVGVWIYMHNVIRDGLQDKNVNCRLSPLSASNLKEILDDKSNFDSVTILVRLTSSHVTLHPDSNRGHRQRSIYE